MELTKTTKIGIWLFTIPAATFLILETRGALHHWQEFLGVWDDHAMFHAVTGLFYTQALTIMIMITAWIPLRRGEAWSWWGLALMSIAIHGGHVLGDQMSNHGLSQQQAGGGPGKYFFYGTLVALAMYILALILTRAHVSRSKG